MKFLIEGRLDLDGSTTAEVQVSGSARKIEANKFIRVMWAKRDCCCRVAKVRHGPDDRIWADRFKLRSLGISEQSEVDVELVTPSACKSITIRTDSSISDSELLKRILGKAYRAKEHSAFFTLSGEPRSLVITKTTPTGDVLVESDTEVIVEVHSSSAVAIGYKDIGGLDHEIQQLREQIEFPLKSPETFELLGVRPPRGVILYGPPGTGKTLLCRALASELGAHFLLISGPELYSSTFAQSEHLLREVFREAESHAPSVIVIDELDTLVPRREQSTQETERRMVATLLTLMDGLKDLKRLVVIGTTNRIAAIDTALIREGRFWPVIKIAPPNQQGRRAILEILAGSRMPLGKDVGLDVIAEKTNGFVGADLAALCREAAYAALRRSASAKSGGTAQTVFDAGHDKIEVTSQDFESALGTVAPSAMHEFMVEMSKVSWSDIGGLDDVKRLLQENVVVAMQQAKELSRIGIKPAKGILLFGPPGTGKTLLAKAIAGEAHSNFISVRGPEVKSKWYGESEEKIRYLFNKARQVAPCIVFFDELDALVPARGRIGGEPTDSLVNQILAELDGIQSADGVIVVGATNRIELLDPAVLRPGRFDYHVEVPLPDLDACRSILGICLAAMPGRDTIPLDDMSQKCRGLSGAEIAEACRRSGWMALREVVYDAQKVAITARHLEQAITEVIENQTKMKPKTIGFQV